VDAQAFVSKEERDRRWVWAELAADWSLAALPGWRSAGTPMPEQTL